jgi:hypothetical protein
MKKYLRYTCTVCQRVADRLLDNVRVLPDKCTITFKCEGRLVPVEYRSNAQIITAPETGVSDWYARGSIAASAVSDAAATFVDTSTGATKQVVIAVQLGSAPGGDALRLALNERSDAPKSYKQYVFRQDATFTTISGVEAGLDKKTLRYSTTDEVQVYVNGVLQEPGTGATQYTLNDGTSTASVPPNTIGFNSPITTAGITQVDVIVSAAATTTQAVLTFNRNQYDESRVGTGSWENVSYVQLLRNGTLQNWYLYTLDLGDADQLTLNTIMTADTKAMIGSILVQASNMMFLLARKPFSNLDRYTDVVVPVSTLTFERDYLKYFNVNGAPALYITETALQTVYPVLRLPVGSRFSTEKTIQTALAGVTDQVVVDGSVIVGPDA